MGVAYGRNGRGAWRLAGVVGLIFALAGPAGAAGAADTIMVVLDQATVARLPPHVATVVVGNPLIADISLQAGGIMVVTGKGYGSTNIVALDRSGNVLMEKSVQVGGPRDNVLVMYRGVERETYSCAPTCERRITLGDSSNFFDPAVQQTGTRNGLAQGSGAPPAFTTGSGGSPGGPSSATSGQPPSGPTGR